MTHAELTITLRRLAHEELDHALDALTVFYADSKDDAKLEAFGEAMRHADRARRAAAWVGSGLDLEGFEERDLVEAAMRGKRPIRKAA